MAPATVTVASDMNSFTYNGQRVPMSKFRSCVGSLSQDAMGVLADELLFCSSGQMLSLCPLNRLKNEVEDAPNSRKPGYSFLTKPENASILKPGFTDVLANLEAHPDGGELLITRTAECSRADLARGSFTITKSMSFPLAVIYEAAADRFLELVLVTILMTKGTPLIGEDLLQVLLVNEGSLLRGVSIFEGVVTIVTMNGHPTNPMTVYTGLHDEVGRMLALYIADVLPLRRRLPTATRGFTQNPHLFAEGNTYWPKERFDKVLKRETGKRLGVEMDVEGYRVWFLEMFKLFQPGMYDADGYCIKMPSRPVRHFLPT